MELATEPLQDLSPLPAQKLGTVSTCSPERPEATIYRKFMEFSSDVSSKRPDDRMALDGFSSAPTIHQA